MKHDHNNNNNNNNNNDKKHILVRLKTEDIFDTSFLSSRSQLIILMDSPSQYHIKCTST